MTSSADLGGMAGFGPIEPEADEPLFHAPWEARVLGMVVALGACGQWNLDQSRSARESLPAPDYVTMSYYQIWLEAAIKLMLDRGMITPEELPDGKARTQAAAVRRKLEAKDVAAVLAAGGPVDRPVTQEAAFSVGDMIDTLADFPETHTRLPRYARDKRGWISRVHGFHVFPDSNAAGLGEDPQWLYQVSFRAQTLWGSRGHPDDIVTLDLWEPYLRKAP